MSSRPRDPVRAEEPSKSQRKRDMLALQALGESLLSVADDRLERLPVTPELIDAVRMARSIRAHEGRRQLPYVGRLMRDIDADALRKRWPTKPAGTRRHRRAAQPSWRSACSPTTRCFAAGSSNTRTPAKASSRWCRARPRLRPVRQAAYRELFHQIRDQLAETAAAQENPSQATPLNRSGSGRSISDRASQGVYQTRASGPAGGLVSALATP